MKSASRPPVSRAVLLFVLATGGLLGLSRAPLAEDIPLDKMPEPLAGSRSLGPLRFRPFFRIEDFGYDDNILLAAEGEEESDVTARLVGGVRGQTLLGHRAAISFEARPEYTAFMHHSSLNYGGRFLEGRGDVWIRDFSLFLGGAWNKSMQRPGTEFDERTLVRSDRFAGGAGWHGSSRLSLSAVFYSEHIRHEDRDLVRFTDIGFECSPESGVSSVGTTPIGTLLNRRESGASLRAGYRMFGRTRAFIEVTHDAADFDGCRGRDSRRRAVLGGLAFGPSSTLSGTIKLGPGRLDARRADRSKYRGLFGKTDLEYRPTEVWKARASGERSLSFSTFGSNLFSVETILRLSLARAVGPRVAVEIGGMTDHSLWPEPFCLSGPRDCDDLRGADLERNTLFRRDHVREVFLGTRLRLLDRSFLTVRLAYRRHGSNLNSIEDARTTLFTGVAPE